MIEFVLGGVMLLLSLRALVAGSKMSWEDGKLWEILFSLVVWGFGGAMGMCMWTWGEEVEMEFLWQWLGLVGVGVLVVLVCVIEEFKGEVQSQGEKKITLVMEWVLRVGMWCAGLGWLWWMMG